MKMGSETKTAAEAGWHASCYNLYAQIPDTDYVAIYNTLIRTCYEFSPLETYILNSLDEVPEDNPFIERMARQGVIARHDEHEALLADKMIQASLPPDGTVTIVVCPTLACNFECPYCFAQRGGKMSAQVQDDVVALAERMLDASGARKLSITWFGGEPLLATDVIEALAPRLIATAEERGCEYESWIFTNGYLLTPEIVDLFGRCKISKVHVPFDGVGATNDATRRLVGGAPTFDRIIENLGLLKPPLKVLVRYNTNSKNYTEIDELKSIVTKRAAETGVKLDFYPAIIRDVSPADATVEAMADYAFRGIEVSLRPEIRHVSVGIDHACSGQNLWMVTVDDEGRLHKCGGGTVGQDRFAFGTAHDWDPANPLATASNPDMLSRYLVTAVTMESEECGECAWLPICGGGCPQVRLCGKRVCPAYKNDPEAFVLAMRDRLT